MVYQHVKFNHKEELCLYINDLGTDDSVLRPEDPMMMMMMMKTNEL